MNTQTPAKAKRGRKPSGKTTTKQRPPNRPPAASLVARKLAAAILEVLAGARTPSEAAVALETSLPRYYLLEQRALAGLVGACEPRTRGPSESPQRRIALLEQEIERLRRERDRQQALARASQRAVGLVAPVRPAVAKASDTRDKKRRRRRPVPRALSAAKELRQVDLVSGEPDSVQRASDSTDIATVTPAVEETR